MLKFRSVKSIVIAPARTGRDKRRRTAVMTTDHTNRGILVRVIPVCRIFITVVIKLIAPRIDLAPARCREKIVRSTEALVWAKLPDKGG